MSNSDKWKPLGNYDKWFKTGPIINESFDVWEDECRRKIVIANETFEDLKKQLKNLENQVKDVKKAKEGFDENLKKWEKHFKH